MLLVLSGAAADNFIISEFMASNRNTLLDGNGNPSDWIELYNAGDTPGNLAGWRLTDDPLDPARWIFPSRVLAPRAFLIVFASGNGAPDAAGNLHVNFQLASAGDYLALIRPDQTIASEFAPAFPAQREDVSYGLGQRVVRTTLLSAGSRARLLIPSASSEAAVGSLWLGGNEPFDDSGWLNVTNAVGYDAPAVAALNLVNVAQGRPVITMDETYPGLPKENLTDGNLNTFTHNYTPVPDFFFIVDLGSEFKLENIEVFNRNDACCPERLSN